MIGWDCQIRQEFFDVIAADVGDDRGHLQWVDEIRYLGLQFASQLGMHATYSSLHSKMWAAWALLQKQFRQLKCAASIGLLFRLYKACVPPTALYGAGVWGPYRLPPPPWSVSCCVDAFPPADAQANCWRSLHCIH